MFLLILFFLFSYFFFLRFIFISNMKLKKIHLLILFFLFSYFFFIRFIFISNMKLKNPFAYSFSYIQLFLFFHSFPLHSHIQYEVEKSICWFFFLHSAISFFFFPFHCILIYNMKLKNPFADSFFSIQLFLFPTSNFHIIYKVEKSICLFFFFYSAISFSYVAFSYAIWSWKIHLLILFLTFS